MNKKTNFLFGILYFVLIIFGYVSSLFNGLYDLLFGGLSIYIFYHSYIIIALQNIFRLLIYILGAVLLWYLYKKVNGNIRKREKKPLTMKQKLIMYLIVVFILTVVSVIANWQLKILTDLGDKYNIYTVYVKLTEIAVLSGEIFLMTCMLYHFDKYTVANFKKHKYFTYAALPVLLTYSIYSLIVDFSVYQIIFIPFTLLLGFLYPYTGRRFGITYLITLLVFLF